MCSSIEEKINPESQGLPKRPRLEEQSPGPAEEMNNLKLTSANIVEEDVVQPSRYNFPEDVERFREEVLKPKRIEYIDDLKFSFFITIVRAFGEGNNWGIYARETIQIGTILGHYAGNVINGEEADQIGWCFLFNNGEGNVVDASKKRNGLAYVNHANSGASVLATDDTDDTGEKIQFSAYEKITPNQQFLLNYGDHYFTNPPIYLHPIDNWKTIKEHYEENKDLYSDEVIWLHGERARSLGLTEQYIAATLLFQAVYENKNIEALLQKENILSSIDMPSFSLELMTIASDQKWKFSEYSVQQHITPLMLACHLGKINSIETLLKHGADPIIQTLHQGHNALFLTILSDLDSSTKTSILDKLIKKAFETLSKKDKAFFETEYSRTKDFNQSLKEDLSKSLQLKDSHALNIFDHMMEKKEYELWKKYFDDSIKIEGVSTKIHGREEKRKIAEKFISDKGILTIIASINGDKNYKEIVEILLENATGKFINQHLKDLKSGEAAISCTLIDSLKTEEIDRILENLRNLDHAKKKGKIVSIVTALLLNETNKLKNQLALGDQVADITTKVQEIRNRFTNVLEHLGSKNKLDTEIRAIERFKTSGCGPSGGGRGKRSAISCRLNANEYIERLRELPTQEQISFTRANEIDFIGSAREVGQAEKARNLLLSDADIEQKSYEMDKLLEDPREERILDLSEDMSQFADTKSSKTKQRLMNAAGRIQLIRGIHGTFASCKSEGLSTDCALSVGEMGFSFLSQPIENRMLKITPRVVKSAASVAGKAPVLGKSLKFAIQLKGMKFGAPIARGVAGGIGGVFDIVDIGMSANTLIICLRKREQGEEPCSDKEIRDSIAGITFGSVSFISGVAFTALAMPGVGAIVGLALMLGQAVYSGISTIVEYEKKYDTTHDENWRIFWHTVAFQPIPQDVQDLAADTEVFKRLAEEAWKRLANSTDVAAIAMGLGNVIFSTELVGRIITHTSDQIVNHEIIEDGNGCTSSDWTNDFYYQKSCSNITVKVPHILPGHANILMNETNADTTKLSRTASIISGSIPANAQMLGLPKWSGKEYEYIDKGVEGIVDGARNPALPSDPFSSVVSDVVAAVAVAVGSVKPLHKAPHYSENPEAIYPCDNAFVIANRTRIANDDKNQTILFDLRYVKEEEVIGSNKWKNAFLVHDGHVQIFGGNNTHNTFHLMNETVSGGVFGGKNASNLLDFSLLNSMTILYSVGGIYGLVYSDDQQRKRKRIAFTKLINHVIGRQGQQEGIGCNDNQEMFVNSGGGYNNDRKDWLTNCKKAVISPCTEATGGDGNYIFYIKPNNILETVGRSEIDVSGNGTLIFPKTALLNDCDKITYSPNNNTLFFEIPLGQNKTFVLEVKNYLNQDKTPKFHLIDKHGSNIVPIIEESESKDDPAQIKSFRLNAEKEAFKDIEEDEAWYRSISQSHEDYQVFGVIKDKQSKQKRIFGN